MVPSVKLGDLSLSDAKSAQHGLRVAIESGQLGADDYAACVVVKAMLNVRIRLAERALRAAS